MSKILLEDGRYLIDGHEESVKMISAYSVGEYIVEIAGEKGWKNLPAMDDAEYYWNTGDEPWYYDGIHNACCELYVFVRHCIDCLECYCGEENTGEQLLISADSNTLVTIG